MIKFVVTLELNADFFRAMWNTREMNKTELKRELKRHIKDELSEYNMDAILNQMIEVQIPQIPGATILCEKG